MSHTPTTPPERDLLFISYAYEDHVFAYWLARKLASFGYGVWIDKLKILGGESWVASVEEAITDRSFRVLAILSKDSITKANPTNERTRALGVGKKLGINDFLMTLNLDGAEPDWTLSTISYISFRESWADGLRRVLKKLKSLEAPRINAGKTGLVARSLEIGSELLEAQAESLICNWLPIPNLPETLKVYDTSRLSKDEIRSWPNVELAPDRVAAFFGPGGDLAAKVSETREAHCWPSVDRIRTFEAQHIVTRILNRSIDQMLRAAGVWFCQETKLHYLPDEFRGERLVRYMDTDEVSHYIKTSGSRTIRKPAGPPEVVTHRPAVRSKARRIAENCYVVELIPAIALFDSSGHPIIGRGVGPRRKKVTQGWFNQKWRQRFLIFAQLLREQSLEMDWGPLEIGAPYTFSADLRLREDRLAQLSPDDDENEAEIVIGIEEMEEWAS
jgi:hypothetical protein